MAEEEKKYITILDAAKFWWRRDPDKGEEWLEAHRDIGYNAQHFYEVGLDILGGCSVCGAVLGAYNGYPSKSGYWKCKQCLGDDGYLSESEFWDEVERQADEFNSQGEDDEY